MKVLEWVKKRMLDVSTKPDITSYNWARRTPSLLARIILFVVWALRLVSIYQWVKAVYRWLGMRFKFGYSENASGRPDVPPMLGEVYFLIYTALFSIAHHFRIDHPFFRYAAMYFIFESSLWIIYYTVFRRFFELGYTIYHQLEYILTIALLIPTQALCFARIYSMSFREAIGTLLGGGGDETPLIIVVFGFFLGAIVIGMIISTFPTENIKKSLKKAKMHVIGCGDVVKSRLQPALAESEYTVSIKGYDISEGNGLLPNYEAADEGKIKEDLDKDLTSNSIVWIETPPDSHAEYAEHCLKKGDGMVVLEKPIAVQEEHIKRIEKLARSPFRRRRIFFLSYYVLEKALPLTYLASIAKGDERRFKFYKKYLDVSNSSLVNGWHSYLGELKSVQVDISEGKDSREWLEDNRLGGHRFETFFHNVMIAQQFCSPVDGWTDVEFSDADYSKEIFEISLTALACAAEPKSEKLKEDGGGLKGEQVKISLNMRKNAPIRNRTARLCFENGEIDADFDKKTAEIEFYQLQSKCTVSVKPEYDGKYSTMVDMVGRVYSSEAEAQEVDGFENQITALYWLGKLNGK